MANGGSGIAFISLVILLLVESLLTDNPWVIGELDLLVSLGGVRCFPKLCIGKKQAIWFQVLTSLAVLGQHICKHGRSIDGLILVSWTEHAENEALINAEMLCKVA